MKLSRNYLILMALLTLISCGGKTVKKTNEYFDFPGYFQTQAALLDSLKPEFMRVKSKSGIPEDETMDSLNWSEEMKLFYTIDLNKPALEGKYKTDVDSAGNIAIERYYTTDSSEAIQEVSVTRVAGEIQVISAVLRKRSFVVDRDVRLSYQPLKGMSIEISENYIWSKPEQTEYFTEISAPGYLKK